MDSQTEVCTRCGGTTFDDVRIHGGHSVRRDCAACGLVSSFPKWHGQSQAEIGVPFLPSMTELADRAAAVRESWSAAERRRRSLWACSDPVEAMSVSTLPGLEDEG